MSKTIWMVRAGQGGVSVDDFLDNGLVAIGFGKVQVSAGLDKSVIEARCAAENPNASRGKILSAASQLKRYYTDVKVGDAVTTYDASQRLYFLGDILSEVELRDHGLNRVRRVRWHHKVPRDSLMSATRNTLGSTLTLFLVREKAAEDVWRNALPLDAEIAEATIPAEQISEDESEQLAAENVTTRAKEFIQDRVASLDWSEMQDLVAEILIAMGYRSRVSPTGADRGQDIFASPDGLGLQDPRIFVEVKHRPNQAMGSNEIRSFLGGRVNGDRCLYVSTGGFTKDARYEAERSAIPITLIDLPQFCELLCEHYEKLRPKAVKLLPLERIYWPIE